MQGGVTKLVLKIKCFDAQHDNMLKSISHEPAGT